MANNVKTLNIERTVGARVALGVPVPSVVQSQVSRVYTHKT